MGLRHYSPLLTCIVWWVYQYARILTIYFSNPLCLCLRNNFVCLTWSKALEAAMKLIRNEFWSLYLHFLSRQLAHMSTMFSFKTHTSLQRIHSIHLAASQRPSGPSWFANFYTWSCLVLKHRTSSRFTWLYLPPRLMYQCNPNIHASWYMKMLLIDTILIFWVIHFFIFHTGHTTGRQI